MGDNQAQRDYWNGQGGDTWVRVQARMDAMLSPLSNAILDVAQAGAGERVIDVGCGCGATSLALHERGAHVWGVDVSRPMLQVAKARAQGLSNIAFSEADAAHQTYTDDHDLVFSRFGVMFFDDPVAAFKNLHSSLNANGRLAFVCWQAPRENPWMSLVGAAIQPLLPEPETPVDPKAPGPFAFAKQDYLTGILEQAGFHNIQLKDFRSQLHVGDTVDDAVSNLGEVGPLARGLAELNDADRQRALDVAKEVLGEHASATGVDLGAAVWLVSATKS